MKRFLSNSLSALLLTVATSAFSLPALSVPLSQTIATRSVITTSAFMVKAPIVTSSGALGSHHVIRLAVGEKSLKDLTIDIPRQMEGYSQLQVVDQTGKEISSKIATHHHQVTIAFDQAIAPGSSLEVFFSGVPMSLNGGETLEYEISAGQDGLSQQVPVGVARVQVPFRS